MTAAPLHLCAFSHSGELGGAELCLAELVERMTDRFDVRFTVVLPEDGPLRTRVEDVGATSIVADLPWWCWDPTLRDREPAGKELAAGLLCISGPLAELVADRPDVIVTSTLTIPWGAVAAVQLDRPHVWWVHEYGRLDHGFEFLLGYRESLRFIADASDHVIATSQAVRDELFPELAREVCSVATYVVDASSVETPPSSFERKNALRLLLLGRVVASKGQVDAVRAVKRLVGSGHDVELCIAGALDSSAEYAAEVTGLIEEAGLGAHIHVLGSVPSGVALMTQADVVLMTSRCEAFGRVTAEAMVTGRPVVGTDCGGTAELVTDGIDGFLYPPGDDGALAAKIAYFIEHPDAVREFGERARHAMTQRISATAVDDRMLAVCSDLVGRRGKGPAEILPLVRAWTQRAHAAWGDESRRRTQEVTSLTARVDSLERMLEEADENPLELHETIGCLELLLDERTAWAKDLEQERLAVRGTFAWRAHSAAVRLKRAIRDRTGGAT
jgi:glycosyltransferase involved in cell wall biosynthesis